MKKRPIFRDTWKDYLSFSKRERNGIFVLLVIIFIQIGILAAVKYFPDEKPAVDFSAFKKEVDEFLARDSLANDSLKDVTDENGEHQFKKTNPEIKSALFVFNPNQLPDDDWEKLGFSDKQIHVIKNFEAKGGKFHSKEDVKKMYCIPEKQYSRIEPYIRIPEVKKDTLKQFPKKKIPERVVVDIGSADSVELTKIRGIGPGFAHRISGYRNKLGGFMKKEQLLEVWGLTDSLYQVFWPQITLNDSLALRKINLNTAEYDELRSHPYIGSQLASLLCNYRKQHIRFSTVDEIKKIPLVNAQLYSKLAPYLRIE
ncbi:MAG: helix-hairpin-helix domain-containing protein [Bacteroidetes bacterium]|nr:helix-hairpin-helix domain-containing protein [Bacteroidota bacterium]